MTNKTDIQIIEPSNTDLTDAPESVTNYINSLNDYIDNLELKIKEQKEQIMDLEIPHFKNEGNPNGDDKVITYCNHCNFYRRFEKEHPFKMHSI